MTEDQWEELLERLTWHAQQKYLRLVWRGVPGAYGGLAPGGIDPADLATQAIVDVIEGRRRWNPLAAPDFLDYLRGVVDSKISHLVRGRENRPGRATTLAEAIPSREPAPESAAADEEELMLLQELLSVAVERDPIARHVVECLEEGVTRPAEMALRVGVDVQEIYNAQKRLRQKIRSALQTDERHLR